ncbi:putative efflux pump membrane fusion protein [Candidatus Ornithobacterium hominis]|uniref:Putative efflux pump membrane fusion protein n=1 Tax=Candidatus Ornithobacterium hominis TaxID=2497989 RepID=A0A383U3E2_9FLAO|nr:biotin/lipoyl-binding protein [Candidatus Ornithobacterium hominis]MCT7904966.1 biotin/lipoyl-binding protein [Candidatus Ornithobacterium hominis]SZD73473.1 putative efflux pump membrane fusion protein [Candidatus Ornithobacterium hominis]
MNKYTIMENKGVIFGILGVFLCFSACSPEKRKKPIEGKAKKESISFSPKVTGRVLEIRVNEGDLVQKGDTLAILDVPEVSAKIAQAKGAIEAANAQMQMAKNGATKNQIRQLRAKQKGLQEQYDYAKKSLNRADNMFRDSLMSPQAHDEIFAKYQGAKAQLDAVNAELNDVLNGTRYEKIEMTQGQANQAKGALQEANIAYSERFVIATNAMELETITLHPGELATAGYPLFNGYIPSTTYFRFTIPESKIAAYPKGSEVTLEVVYNQQQIKGKIINIKQLTRYADITTAFPDYQMEEAVYEIKILPQKQQETQDILANAQVILKEK